jgi:hypothetical protein
MRDRLLLLGLATFCIPFLILIAEVISWFFQATPFMAFATQTMPDLFKLILIVWFSLLIYASVKLASLLTKPIQNNLLRVCLNVLAVFGLTMLLFFVGFSFMVSATSNLTIRAVKAPGNLGLTHPSSGTPSGAAYVKR